VANVFGWEVTATQQALIAFVIVLLGTAANVAGRLVLKLLMTGSIIAEILGSLGLGLFLLLFHRENSFSVLTEGFSTEGYLSLGGPFLVAMAFVGWSFVGFESAGSIAEEVHHPRRNIPKAVIFSISFIAIVVMFSSLSIILAIPPDIAANSSDPVFDTLVFQLGDTVAKFAEVLFTIGFLASFLALQTSASRLIWSYARDNALPAPKLLSRLTKGQQQPAVALVVATVIGSIIIYLSQAAPDFYTLMLNFTSGGFYLAFLFPLIGALYVKLTKKWIPGPFSLGPWSMFVSVIAVIWAVFQFLNIAWPRDFYGNWLNWSIYIAVIGLAIVGGIIYLMVRKRITTVDVIEIDDPDDDSATRDYLASDQA
jgi:amino acid transporter